MEYWSKVCVVEYFKGAAFIDSPAIDPASLVYALPFLEHFSCSVSLIIIVLAYVGHIFKLILVDATALLFSSDHFASERVTI